MPEKSFQGIFVTEFSSFFFFFFSSLYVREKEREWVSSAIQKESSMSWLLLLPGSSLEEGRGVLICSLHLLKKKWNKLAFAFLKRILFVNFNSKHFWILTKAQAAASVLFFVNEMKRPKTCSSYIKVEIFWIMIWCSDEKSFFGERINIYYH